MKKSSKQADYDKYFERNWNDIKNTWKGIKSIIFLYNGDTITNPYDIVNINNYFASIAKTIKKSINIHITFFRLSFQ